jgi:hypothetical protein
VGYQAREQIVPKFWHSQSRGIVQLGPIEDSVIVWILRIKNRDPGGSRQQRTGRWIDDMEKVECREMNEQ